MSIQELYAGIATDELRNWQITDDVIRAHSSGRNALILTERTAHVELLAERLREKIPDVVTLRGGRGRKEPWYGEVATSFVSFLSPCGSKLASMIASSRVTAPERLNRFTSSACADILL